MRNSIDDRHIQRGQTAPDVRAVWPGVADAAGSSFYSIKRCGRSGEWTWRAVSTSCPNCAWFVGGIDYAPGGYQGTGPARTAVPERVRAALGTNGTAAPRTRPITAAQADRGRGFSSSSSWLAGFFAVFLTAPWRASVCPDRREARPSCLFQRPYTALDSRCCVCSRFLLRPVDCKSKASGRDSARPANCEPRIANRGGI
jgi:hypothetical protein